MRWLIIAVVVLVALVVAVVAIGYMLPVKHRASREAVIAGATPEAVFALVSNASDYPRWRTGIARVEVVAGDPAAPTRFREHSSDGAILYDVVERAAPRRMVTRIADPGLPFGGGWTFEIEPADGAPGGTRVRITEDGEVYNPVFRFVSRFVMGHTSSIERYLVDLQAQAGRPRPVAGQP
jgi:hypothetical protein